MWASVRRMVWSRMYELVTFIGAPRSCPAGPMNAAASTSRTVYFAERGCSSTHVCATPAPTAGTAAAAACCIARSCGAARTPAQRALAAHRPHSELLHSARTCAAAH